MKRKIGFSFIITLIFSTILVMQTVHGEATDGTSMLRILHAVPDAPTIDVYLDNESIAENLSFKNATDYITVNEGAYEIEIYEAGTKGTNEPLSSISISVRANEVYTLLAANRIENIDLKLVENAMDVPLGQSMVRVGHLSPDTPTIDFVTGVTTFNSVSFGDVTDYEIVDAGSQSLHIKGDTEATLPLDDIELKQNNIYTIYALNTNDDLEHIVLVDYTMVPGTLPKTGLGGTASASPNVLPLLIGLGCMILWSLFTLLKRKKNA